MELAYIEKHGSTIYVEMYNVPAGTDEETIIEWAKDHTGSVEFLHLEEIEQVDEHSYNVRFSR